MKTIKLIIAALAWSSLLINPVKAQNGESLFKAKCNTCHLVDKASTGPLLKGIKQKWNDAGEGELLYEWVNDPAALVASGKSTLALAAKNFSSAEMTPQQVSKEEIDAILDYVDNYAPPVPDVQPDQALSPEPIHGTDYVQNLNIFYVLIMLIFLLIIGVFVMGSSITLLLKSNYFKSNMPSKKEGKAHAILALIGSFGLISLLNTSHALSLSLPEEETPWLKVEDTDLYVLLMIIALLFAVLIYLRTMFKDCLQLIHPVEPVAKPRRSYAFFKKTLTDAVPIEEEHKILLQHEYDGIRELDNNLPPWWLWGFYATIVFAVVYLLNYHVLGTADSQMEEYQKDMKQSEAEVKAYLKKMALNVDENTVTLLTESGDLATGKALYTTHCTACHADKGEGRIGPNLTDKAWIYGFDIKDLFKVVKNGTPKGMPEHNSKLNPVQLQQVASFVLSLPEATGKDPEGTMIEK